ISARHGLLIRNRAQFEKARNLDAVVFDKTGTLTKGEFGVTDIIPVNGYEEKDVLNWAASLENHSEHPLAAGIVQAAKEKEVELKPIHEFESITGKGIQGVVENKKVKVVSPNAVSEQQKGYDEKQFKEMAQEGKTVVLVILDDVLTGMIALADIVRDTAKEAIAELKENHIHSIMLTGDNQKVADWVANQTG